MTDIYKEFMPLNYIQDSYDGVSTERINFEKKIKFLLLLQKFSTLGFMLNNEKIDVNTIKITRDDIKNYLESYLLNPLHIEWINSIFPNKIIRVISKSYLFYDKKLEKIIKKDEDYINEISPEKYKLICEIYKKLNNNEKSKIFDFIIESNNYTLNSEIYNIFININKNIKTEEEIIDFFNNFIDPNTETNKLIEYISFTLLYNKIKKNNKHTVNLNNTWNDKFNIIMNIKDENFLNNLQMDNIRNKLIKTTIIKDKINFVNNYFETKSIKIILNIADNINFGIFGIKILKNKEFIKYENSILYNLLKLKYFNKICNELQEHAIIYLLDIETHYKLYTINEKKYIDIILYNELIKDYTFSQYNFNNYCFLDNYNNEVKTYLKNKICNDTNKTKKKNIEISSLNNFIDIMYFIHNPPLFLRLNKVQYYSEYIKLMDTFVKEFNYDFIKVNYKNFKPKLIFENINVNDINCNNINDIDYNIININYVNANDINHVNDLNNIDYDIININDIYYN